MILSIMLLLSSSPNMCGENTFFPTGKLALYKSVNNRENLSKALSGFSVSFSTLSHNVVLMGFKIIICLFYL
jgi:hypothetical protein